MGRIISYFREVATEAKKVTWPSQQQTIEKTLLVLAVSLIVGIYIGALDFIFQRIITVIL